MKKECKNCKFNSANGCIKNKKNGYFNCATYRSIPIDDLIKERKQLLTSKDNPERLEYLTNKITEVNGGIL